MTWQRRSREILCQLHLARRGKSCQGLEETNFHLLNPIGEFSYTHIYTNIYICYTVLHACDYIYIIICIYIHIYIYMCVCMRVTM